MEGGFILLVVGLMVYTAQNVQGLHHLSFSNATVNVTRDGCGTTQLCVETPEDCDPAGNGPCLFTSVMTTAGSNGFNMSFSLRGDSEGYIALGLTGDASQGITLVFVCARNETNGTMINFRTFNRNNTNNNLTASNTTVNQIRRNVMGNVIRCQFHVPGLNATTTRADPAAAFNIGLQSGSLSDLDGPFNFSTNSGRLDLTNPAANIATTPAPTTTMASNTTMASITTMAPTTAASGSVRSHGLLVLFGVLMLSDLLRS